MAELVHVCEHEVEGPDGTRWVARVLAEPRRNVWIGWLEFAAVGKSDVVRTGEETSQPTREAVAYWASGLEPVFLEGALDRAREGGSP